MTYCQDRRTINKRAQVCVPNRIPIPCLLLTYAEWLRYRTGDLQTVVDADRLRNGAPVVAVVGQNLEVVTR